MAGEESAQTPQADAARVTLVAKLVAATPFALATLSVLYDVGYFARIGLDFFPLFSLTEHLMFGMAGIPYLIAIFVSLYFVILGNAFRASRLKPAERAQAEGRFNRGLAVGFLIAGVWRLIFHPGVWPNAALAFITALMLELWTSVEGHLKAFAIIGGNFVIWLLASFAMGYWIAAGVLNSAMLRCGCVGGLFPRRQFR